MGWFEERRGVSGDEPGKGCPLVRDGRNSSWMSRICKGGGKAREIFRSNAQKSSFVHPKRERFQWEAKHHVIQKPTFLGRFVLGHYGLQL